MWKFLKKLKIELPYDPAILCQGIYPKESKVDTHRNFSPSMFIAALFTIAKMWKQPKCPSKDELIRKCGNTSNVILFRSVGAQYATGDQWRNNSRKNEEMQPKQKQYPVID